MNNLEQEIFGNIKPKNNSKILIFGIISISVLIVCLIIYLVLSSTGILTSGKKVFEQRLEANAIVLNHFIEDELYEYGEQIHKQSYEASGTYFANGKLKENNSYCTALNDTVYNFKQYQDNANNKTAYEINQLISNVNATNIYFVGENGKFYIKVNDVTNEYIEVENKNINTLLGYCGISNSELFPSSVKDNYSDEKLHIILEETFKKTMMGMSSSKFEKAKKDDVNCIVLNLKCSEMNTLVTNFIGNLFNNQDFKKYLTQKNDSITTDNIKNLEIYLKQEVLKYLTLTDEQASVIVYEEGDKQNTIEIAYGDLYVLEIELTDSKIVVKNNNNEFEISKNQEETTHSLSYNSNGDLFDFHIESSFEYQKYSTEKLQKNFYIKIGKSTENVIYQVNKTYNFKENVSPFTLTEEEFENVIDISSYNKNEVDDLISKLKIRSNSFYLLKLYPQGLKDSFNPLTLSIPGVFLKCGILSNDMGQFRLDSTNFEWTTDDEEEQREDEEREEETEDNENEENNNEDEQNDEDNQEDREDEIIQRNKDYFTYTNDIQSYESVMELIDKVKQNNYFYDDDELKLDIYTYYPNNFEKGGGNLLSAFNSETSFDIEEDKNYVVGIEEIDGVIKYITIVED